MNDLFEGLDIQDVEVKEEKKEVKKEKKEVVKEKKGYEFPFRLYYAASYLEIDHIFEEGKSYTQEEITKGLLEHQFYEFSGKVTYDFKEEENVLIPIFEQHKKG